MKPDPRSAVLTIIGRPPKSDEKVTIGYEMHAAVFVLCGSDRAELASSQHPNPLVKYAWANGALEICHDYDLKLAEWP